MSGDCFAGDGAAIVQLPCPTCSGTTRETVGMVCQTCGTDYRSPEVRAYEQGYNDGVDQERVSIAKELGRLSETERLKWVEGYVHAYHITSVIPPGGDHADAENGLLP